MGANTGTKIDPRWAKLQELFSRAVELPPAQRPPFIESETARDPGLREELLDLLAADSAGATSPLTNALGAALDTTTRDRRRALIGCILGSYKLVSILGHGGTGTVYLGERSDRQYSAQVAVKVVDTATLHGDLSLRFRAERQILASLNHPNIARLIDAGETPGGQPYLVMEYVHGEPVDRYCDRRQLDLRARLSLFLEICNAVQYAHQNLIVHRDLKPANILVTPEGAPKLLDFGIAKLLDSGDEAAMLALTRLNDRLLTPEYASPEQILGRTVTTASDVYALGVVLYELLTGLRPYTVPNSASQLELERSICVNDPVRPSAAVRRAQENGAAEGQSEISPIATARGLTPEKLERRLTGDVDAIIMRALRKEPESRYGSVDQLAADVRRYLAREPVQARQGNWLYYSQRFMRRHAVGVTAGITFFVFVIAFAVAMSIQTQRVADERDRAAQESERAEKVSDFMLKIFSASDPFTTQGKEEVTARALLDEAGRNIRGDLSQHPEVRARLLEAMGKAYRRQNEYERAISFLEEALHLRKQLPDADGAKTASVLTELAVVLHQSGDIEGSDDAVRQALRISEQHENQRTVGYAVLLANLGRVKLQGGDINGARGYYERSLALNRELLGPVDPEVASVLLDLSLLYMWQDDLEGAERVVRESVSIYRQKVSDGHPDRVLAESRLADVLLALNRVGEAGTLFEKTLDAQKVLYGENSHQVANVLESLARVRRVQGMLTEAEDFARQALRVQTQALGSRHYMTGYFRSSLASLLIQRGKMPEAENELRQSLDIYSSTLPPDHQYIASSEHLLGEVLLATNRLVDAEAMLTAATNRWKRTEASPWRAARSASALGETLYRQGRAKEAERYLVESYHALAADESAEREARIDARERVTRFYTDRGQREKLESVLLAANQGDSAATRQ